MCRVSVARDLERDVKFTRHAINRMTARGILKPTVLAVVAHGRWVPNNENELIFFDGWCVVMDDNRVVTAFEREHWR